mmetsp:Transcript_22655/g.55923  ORF Transcript_22655/g.55923 Transcript_22655/m.55923 type:complete len:487 (-) Transcript_22655:44-1504(-)|eukprot:CAMPEP_0206282900 /NCGR_PEP_ID=MMETSP0047_2-20121206/39937_1 /ASSEMBLY_ACC=CAM_ASM_000192 /TAXON_ID=195065 /ORGANISM="Chroomonas mesostigmatica_cf, Strain CCMP1168" /LENGTH=486 /DNA_ID=CAMNT_0053713217 /DNA_START=131 /DNA_END=1591 /DNA_ORIENTATION=+
MAARSKGRLAPDFMIMQRRKEEDHRRVYDEKSKIDEKLENLALWEHKTATKIQRNAISTKINTITRDLEDHLNARRAKLAEMLNQESDEYTRELQALEETPEMRRDRLKSRARELIRRREQEKREFAQLMRERQFRESCDAFREHDGVQLLRECMHSRDKALEERLERKQLQREEDAMWHQKLLALIRSAEEREAADKTRETDLRSEMLRTLEEQVRELKARKEEDERLKQEEARLMKERFELDLIEARQREEERQKMFAEKKVAIAKHNQILRAEKEAEIRRQQEEDLALLNAMLEKERQAEEAEQTYKSQLRAQAREYQAQLIELMKKEAVDEAASEAIRKAEQDKAWRKREEVWEKERAARERLMKDVMEVRKEQLKERLESNKRGREIALIERERMMAEVEDMEHQDALNAAIRANIQKQHQAELIKQIEVARRNMRREMELAALEMEASRREEEAYQARLHKEMYTQRPPKNHGLKSTGLF